MARPTKVPREDGLRAAMHVFWARGFTATSLDDLQAAMGLQRGSLYLRHKDKASLFREVLVFYRREVVEARRARILAAPSVRAGIEGFFAELVDHSLRNREYPGCLNTNSVVELGVVDSELGEMFAGALVAWENFWFELITGAVRAGQLPGCRDARRAARVMVTLTQGVNVMSKVNKGREALLDAVLGGLSVLGD